MGKLENRRFIGRQFFSDRKKKIIDAYNENLRNTENVTNSLEHDKNIKNMTENIFYEAFNNGRSRVDRIELPIINKDESRIDVSIVIPIKGRIEQLPSILYFINREIEKNELNIKVVIVEQNSISTENKRTCEEYNADYIFINSNEVFNKCLCHNVGSFLHNSKYIMFHDVDLIVPNNFFRDLFINLGERKAIQCFSKRRVFYIDENISNIIRLGKDLEILKNNNGSIREGKEGAPGGSIIINRDFFESIGGFDHNLFWGYSIEDGFFWKKISNKIEMNGCNNPNIDMYHLWHEPTHNTNPNLAYEHRIYHAFVDFNIDRVDFYLDKCKDEYNKIKNRICP